jgi:hypothetical protein
VGCNEDTPLFVPPKPIRGRKITNWHQKVGRGLTFFVKSVTERRIVFLLYFEHETGFLLFIGHFSMFSSITFELFVLRMSFSARYRKRLYYEMRKVHTRVVFFLHLHQHSPAKELLILSSKGSFNFSRTFQGCLRLLCACCVSSQALSA